MAHRRKWSPAAISYLFLLVIIAGVTAENVSLPAFTRIYESIYCRQYYAEHDPSLIGRDGGDGVPEEFCKISQVQGEVAMLRAWQTFFDSVGTISLAVPWGYYADVRGRKPVLVMVTASLLARAVWMQVVFAMFFRYGASQLFATFISSPLAAFLMQFGLFVPTVVGTCLMGLMVALTSLLPETLNYSAGAAQICDTTPPPKSSGTVRERVRHIPARVRDSTAFLWSDIRVAILVPTYLVHMLIYETNNLLVQYASARFNIAISRATLIIALQSALIIVQLLFILPAITRFLTARLHISPQRKDLLLARWSALFLSAGFLGVGLAPTLPLLVAAVPFEVAGWGLMFVTRSLITTFVEPHHVARLYTVLTLVDVAGLMLGAPAFAWLFDRGLEAGGAAAGLPFVVCSAAIAAAGALTLLIRVEDGPTGGPEGREGLLARPEESSGADPES
ncbi:hypothetical protein SLS56_010765 [Neofusicoccum ribis]|uniref:MFS transporter n=1 Tax=Neofusicoccum ribis TaxID=45134 RepID=A0ABR3SF40_9PEZI